MSADPRDATFTPIYDPETQVIVDRDDLEAVMDPLRRGFIEWPRRTGRTAFQAALARLAAALEREGRTTDE